MKEFAHSTAKQLLPILAAAGVAAAFAFGQSIANSAGFCPAPSIPPAELGLIGGMIKAGQQAISNAINFYRA